MAQFALIGPLLILFVLATAELSTLLWSWNAAAKAAQYGARLAATSTPVADDLVALSTVAAPCTAGTNCPGDPIPYFNVVCSGATATCSGGGGAFDATALDWIVRGTDGACGVASGQRGMCDVYARILPANVTITYENTGMGFMGNPSGPTPSITVRVQGLTFATPVLGSVSQLLNITMPPFTTTVTAEDMRSTTS